ncbi:MAG: hypothetical protein UU16_C0057G0002 [Candidatus Woesebacteria bacterium GW2011_GWA2_40_7]|uniref:Uncharacterized protein n=3 Tax=Candidatus Woeseibacteriota TaxID=1752722 RepID=A0A0G0UXV5_9BACT|nr:MAG: hypothetical protein UT17_C0001G0145 [Candidatus Woesebacteria bacterium GW2011_GWB1_39_10]KKR71636.1 MAG: hypothetical protein UU16_C0057G0002 [Candidatus Woesebacteria bacterium GW2011_GWA2_40_7]KKR92331.1 MAG: hypothetical protein UU42_C0002G0145 [Candidatus Woesebacteria bacterium GW2011_GWA1_41_13b]
MVENTIRVTVDEELSKISGKSRLVAELVDGGKVSWRMTFSRETSPLQISEAMNETGCFIKYDEDTGLSEEDRNDIGDSYIEASYNVPGLGEE